MFYPCRDLKPQNMLISWNITGSYPLLRLCDMGSCKPVSVAGPRRRCRRTAVACPLAVATDCLISKGSVDKGTPLAPSNDFDVRFTASYYLQITPGSHASPWVTSRFYRAPELLCGSTTYGPEVDVWALGE